MNASQMPIAELTSKIRELVTVRNELSMTINYYRSKRRFHTCDILRCLRNNLADELESEADKLDKLLS